MTMSVVAMWAQWHWREPLWLWLAAYPLLIWLWAVIQGLLFRQPWLEPKLLPWMRYGSSLEIWRWLFNRSWLWAGGWVLLAVALAGPRLPQFVSGTAQASQRDVMVVMDLSRSMTATDVRPSRLARSKQSLQALLRHSRDSRYGLVLYSLKPHLLFPLTYDQQAASHYLRSVEHGLMPGEGSVVAPALRLAQAELEAGNKGANKAGRAILWVSDGDVSDADALQAEMEKLQQQGIKLIIYAVGSVQGSGLQTDKGEWLEHEGTAARTALPRQTLRQLASSADALYQEWGSVEADWRRIYEEGILPLSTASYTVTDGATRQWQPLYAPFLYAGLGLLFLSLVARGRQVDKAALILCAGLLSGVADNPVYAADRDGWRAAYQAYEEKDYELAWQRYAALAGFEARMGQAQSAYQLARFGVARQQYVLAFMVATDDPQRSEALFNLANSSYQMGDYTAALEAYGDVLRYQPKHPGALLNLEYARALQAEVALFRKAEGRGAGRGPRTAEAEPGEDLTNKGVTLGEDKTEPVAFSWSDKERKALVIKGVEFARLISDSSSDSDGDNWQYEIRDLSSLERARILPRREHKLFWRRLFAHEEGLAAPPAAPQTEDGVEPW